jgi:hypothetical protein
VSNKSEKEEESVGKPHTYQQNGNFPDPTTTKNNFSDKESRPA